MHDQPGNACRFDFAGKDARHQTDNPTKQPEKTKLGDVPSKMPSLPIIIEAWSSPDSGRQSLTDIFFEHGGGYVWCHETQSSRWYYIGETMVLEYRIRRPLGKDSSSQKMKTVISKQWISKDTLVKAGYDFTDYGEGSYSIPGRLTPISFPLSRLLGQQD